MSMIDLDHTNLQPPRPIADDNGDCRTVLYSGYTIFSVFQPVFSISHRRAIGYHASLRAHDEENQHTSSHTVFAQAAQRGDLLELGRLAESLHLGNFHTFGGHDAWLFLNLHPAALLDTMHGDALLATLKRLGLAPQRIVLEIPEQAGGDVTRFAVAIEKLRKAGFLIALSGFGAKHSNIDRVWQLRPDIVTFDHGIFAQASEHAYLERVLPGMVSLLHESGQLVLMGGLTSERDALIALECDVDFVQGRYFAEPHVEPAQQQASAELIDRLSDALRIRIAKREQLRQIHLSPYIAALKQASAYITAGQDAVQAAAPLLALAETARCFLLGASGRQIGENLLPHGRASRRAKRFRPLLHSEGASWDRRSYFIEAMRKPGRVYLTPPYLSINEAHLCVTASIAARTIHGMQVLCVDIDWESTPHSKIDHGGALGGHQKPTPH